MDRSYEKSFIEFIKQNEGKAKKVLTNHFPVLSEDDIQDIIYDSYAIMHKSITEKKVAEPQYPYFLRICYNLSLKTINKQGSHIIVGINETDIQQPNMVSINKVESILQVCEDNESIIKEKKELVHEALSQMAKKCKELLWSFYADELNWATIAAQCGLKNADTAKSAASRCRQTFKEKYNHLRLQYYGK